MAKPPRLPLRVLHSKSFALRMTSQAVAQLFFSSRASALHHSQEVCMHGSFGEMAQPTAHPAGQWPPRVMLKQTYRPSLARGRSRSRDLP